MKIILKHFETLFAKKELKRILNAIQLCVHMILERESKEGSERKVDLYQESMFTLKHWLDPEWSTVNVYVHVLLTRQEPKIKEILQQWVYYCLLIYNQ